MLNSVSWAKSPKAMVTSARYSPVTRSATPPSTSAAAMPDERGHDQRRAEGHAELGEGVARARTRPTPRKAAWPSDA